MILQALYEYYLRKASDHNSTIAPEGWEWKEIPYLIVINSKGRFVSINETREGEGNVKRARRFLVPQGVKRTVGTSANLLWDNIEYALGANPRKRDDIAVRHEAFKQRILNELLEKDIPSINALVAFLGSEPVKQIENSTPGDMWKQILEENAFITFKLDGENHATVCDDIRGYWNAPSQSDSRDGLCLITGERNVPIARLHPSIKGVRGTNTQGGSLVSFNLPAFNSYGKTQNYNSPISESTTFAYTTALNLLLGKDSQNKAFAGDATTVFWGEKKGSKQSFDLEGNFAWYITDHKDDPDRGVQAVKGLYEAIHTGSLSQSRERFYVLGLAPNAARISVRFFRQGTVREFGEKIKRHFDDFEIVRSPRDPEYLSLYRILTSIALEYKMENVPPNLAGAVIESILDGTQYPATLLQQCIRRIRAEVARKDQNGKLMQNVTRTRAAVLKASLNRLYRSQPHNTNKEILMALDPQNSDVAYLLGRLFALLERIQEESAKPSKLKATIRERFYASFSSSPSVVMPLLMRLKNHHLAKLGSERDYLKRWFEEQIGEVIDLLKSASIPAHLALEQQAQFAVGYYHQRMHRKEKQS
jgi:CRISPR-associated protein Csd1